MRLAARVLGVTAVAGFGLLAADAGRAAPSAHSAATRTANAQLSEWLRGKQRWAARRLASRDSPAPGTQDHIDYHLAFGGRALSPPTADEARAARATKELYDEIFPPSDPASHLGTFVESANPWVDTPEGGYQWNSVRASGIDDPRVFAAAIDQLVALGFRSVRLGPNLFEIDPERPASWSRFLDKIDILWERGVTPTISVAFFPSLSRWETRAEGGSIDHTRSYLLHPDFATDLARMSESLIRGVWERAEQFERTHPGRHAHVVVNAINEPETLAGFNRQFWHDRAPGWESPELMRYYVPSVVAIAEAAVRIRLAVERSTSRRVLFLHNEAMTPKTYPSHGGEGRFAVSKLALGDAMLSPARLDRIRCADPAALARDLAPPHDEIDWALRAYALGAWNHSDEQRRLACEELRARLLGLQRLHQELRATTGKTMKTDTMLHLDYYSQTESTLDRPVEQLVAELSAEDGARLRQVAAIGDHQAFLAWLGRQIAEVERKYPGVRLPAISGLRPSRIDFAALLRAEDDALLAQVLDLRHEYALRDEPLFRERQERVGLRALTHRLERTDEVLADLVADDGALLRELLGVTTDEALRDALAAAARNTDDGGPAIAIRDSDSLRAILNRDQRRILHRILGLRARPLLGFEPTNYARQVRAGLRRGLYSLGLEYINQLRVYTIGVGEAGTPYYAFAPLLHDQLLMEYVALLESGTYGTQYALGPAVDTRGWALGPLSHPLHDDTATDPCGILSLGIDDRGALSFVARAHDAHPQPWVRMFLEPLYRTLRRR